MVSERWVYYRDARSDKYRSNVLIDPLFQLHHGVSKMRCHWLNFLTFFYLQMVDKIWYDWQHAHPANFWSFDGGAVAQVTNFVADPNFPNGAPPYVTVSGFVSRQFFLLTSLQFATTIPTDGIMSNYSIYELIDTRNERLCYIYE